MPEGLVKSKADHKKWAHCKSQYPEGTKRRYAKIMGCFLKYKANASRKGKK
jgi:hypothetical protein